MANRLDRLCQDDDYGETAQMAIGLSALLTLPRNVSDPTPLNVGGVSDITNRGKPQNLLMTELAADPMLLAARIAHGQALYLRRESPPAPSPNLRPMAIESGIRTWGKRRLMLAATALAIANAETRSATHQVAVVTLDDTKIHEETFETFEGITKHLERLSIAHQSSAALSTWLDSLESPTDSANGQVDHAQPVVVMTAATMKDEIFQAWLRTCPTTFLIAEVDEASILRLKRRSPMGIETIQQIDLANCANAYQRKRVDSSSGRRTPIERTDQSSPALFLDIHPAPLRFGASGNEKWKRAVPEIGVFMISSDARLMFYDRPGIGARCLVERLPSSKVHAFQCDGERFHMLVGHLQWHSSTLSSAALSLVTGDLDGESVSMVSVTGDSRGCRFVFDRGDLFRIGDDVRQVSLASGQLSEPPVIQISKSYHLGGPVFRHLNEYYVVTGGTRPVAERLIDCSGVPIQIQSAYRAIDDGAIVMASHGNQDFVRFQDQPDGSPFKVVNYRSALSDTVVAIDRGEAETLGSKGNAVVARQSVSLWAKPRSLMHRISSIACSRRGIHLRKGKYQWTIHPVNRADTEQYPLPYLRLLRTETDAVRRSPNECVVAIPNSPSIRHKDGSQWSLREFCFGEFRIFVDTRGMIHLRRGDEPHELTLVLSEQCLSGWASWGETFGEDYYLGDGSRSCPPRVVEWLDGFVAGVVQ